MDKQILEKIQKLLALSTSPNEHEAALAAAKASELMIAHDINASQLIDNTVDEDVRQSEFKYGSTRDSQWKSVIAAGVAELNMCEHWRTKSGKNTHFTFLGKPSRTELCKQTLDYLCGAVTRMLEDHISKIRRDGCFEDDGTWHLTADMKPGDWLAYRNSFKKSAASSLRRRLQQEKARRQQDGIKNDDVQINALVVADAYAVAAKEIQPHMPRMRTFRMSWGGAGSAAGAAAGNSISLNRQVGSQGQSRLLN
tara:strand:- start:226 stop:984 length:759 start_codon:yes stop_codon:yes gene_type:complete